MTETVTDWLARDEGSEISDSMRPELIDLLPTFSRQEPVTAYMMVGDGKYTSSDFYMSVRLTTAAHMLRSVVEIDPNRAGGVPVLIGTRFTVARIIAELADGMTVTRLSRQYDLNKDHITELLHGISILFDRPFYRY